MYVEHVAAGIASMCHRGNHAGNAEAHLPRYRPAYTYPRAIPYIFTVSVLPQTVFPLLPSRSRSPLRSVFRSFSQHALARKFSRRIARREFYI